MFYRSHKLYYSATHSAQNNNKNFVDFYHSDNNMKAIKNQHSIVQINIYLLKQFKWLCNITGTNL